MNAPSSLTDCTRNSARTRKIRARSCAGSFATFAAAATNWKRRSQANVPDTRRSARLRNLWSRIQAISVERQERLRAHVFCPVQNDQGQAGIQSNSAE